MERSDDYLGLGTIAGSSVNSDPDDHQGLWQSSLAAGIGPRVFLDRPYKTESRFWGMPKDCVASLLFKPSVKLDMVGGILSRAFEIDEESLRRPPAESVKNANSISRSPAH